jgi:GT2 family glycosyltransferase
MSKGPPLLSVVLCNSNSADYTLGCIESLYLYPPDGPYEIILVDNASRDDCVARVRAAYPEVRVAAAARPQGFSRNYNMGIRMATGEYLLILNNDTVVAQGTLQRLIDAMAHNPAYGMVGPLMVGGDGHIQTPCLRPLPSVASFVLRQILLDPGLPLGRVWQWIERRRIASHPSGPVPCISGAAMLVSRRSLDLVGMLDETYDFYYEDVEWCHRMQNYGFVVGYVAESRLVHFGGQSSVKVKVWARQHEYLSIIHYFRQYRGLGHTGATLIWLAAIIGFLVRGIGFLLAETWGGKPQHARAYLYLWHWLVMRGPDNTEAS